MPRGRRARSDATETLIDLLLAVEATHGSGAAVSMRAGLREDTWSYQRLWRAANAVARHLTEEGGVRPGDRVVVWGPNSPALVATLFGALLARIVVVPIDPHSSPGFVERVVERTEAVLLITGFPLPPGWRGRTARLDRLPLETGRPFAGARPTGDDVAEIVFTSGTTGTPKGVVLTHANIVADVVAAGEVLGERPRHVLSILPLSHMLEQTAGLFLPLSYGATIHYLTSRQSPVILRALRRHRVVAMVVVPQVLTLLLDAVEREVRRRGEERSWRRAHRLAAHLPTGMRRGLFRPVHRELGGRLELFFCGGAYLSPDVASAWERLGVTVLEGYGATECAPAIATNTRAARRPGSVGKPLTGVEVCVSGEGEVLVRGANVTPGYWRDDQATRAAFTGAGWFRTGDLGEIDGDGFLHLRGRLKDVIVLPNGMKVHPEDVEPELDREDAVEDCVVLGLEDDAGNARVHAAVIPAEAAGTTAPPERVAAAVRSANARLAPHQRISGFTLWEQDDFPRTSLLKVKRHETLAALSGAPRAPAAATPAPSAEEDRHVRLRRLLARLGDVGLDAVGPECDLALDLDLDSLARIELAVELESELGVAVDDDALAAAGTVAELLAVVERGETAAPAVAFRRWPLRRPARLARRSLQAVLLLPAQALVCRPFRVEGAERLRGVRAPVLLIANHTSHLDTPSILRALPSRIRRRVAVAAAADYFFRTRRAGVVMALLLNAFPFSRAGTVRASLEHCGDLVDGGWSVLVYPEGTRSPTGELQPFKHGIGLLATDLRVPVVPIALAGPHAILPKGRNRPRRGPVTVRFGDPIVPAPSSDHRETAERLERAVAELVAQGP